MMLYEAVKLALQAIKRNAMRSFLTVLGIVIGVAAVIAMVTIGNGTTAKVKSELSRLGSNMLSISPGQFGPGRPSAEAKAFKSRDVEVIRAQITGGVAWGLGPVLQNAITLRDGVVEQTNFHDYQPLRLAQMPVVDVHILPSSAPPTGVGELGVPCIAPAVANAVYAATGHRVRVLPITVPRPAPGFSP